MFQVFTDYCRTHFVSALNQLFFQFQTLVFPFLCLKCRRYMEVDREEVTGFSACFCEICMPAEPCLFALPFCSACGKKFESIPDLVPDLEKQATPKENTHWCEACLTTPPPVDRVRAAFYYQGIIQEAIPLFKYHSKLCLARVFENPLFQAFNLYFFQEDIDLILPIPLHVKKMRARGFNQSFLLVRHFKKIYRQTHGYPPGWVIDTHTLARVKPTLAQTGFDVQQRRDNLKDAFQISPRAEIDGKNILLVDDVYTTGATCNEAARVLLKAGAARVDALVLARA